MNNIAILMQAINDALALLPPEMKSNVAIVELVAISLQEDKAQERTQRNGGPARGLWQFERGGGVNGVMTHPAVRDTLKSICTQMDISFDAGSIWQELATNDVFAAVCARLLLWTDGAPMPALGDAGAAWSLYTRVWRPGHPRPADWRDNYQTALGVITTGA